MAFKEISETHSSVGEEPEGPSNPDDTLDYDMLDEEDDEDDDKDKRTKKNMDIINKYVKEKKNELAPPLQRVSRALPCAPGKAPVTEVGPNGGTGT